MKYITSQLSKERVNTDFVCSYKPSYLENVFAIKFLMVNGNYLKLTFNSIKQVDIVLNYLDHHLNVFDLSAEENIGERIVDTSIKVKKIRI